MDNIEKQQSELAGELGNESMTEHDVEVTRPETDDWNTSPENPFNWPSWKKALQVVMLSSSAILA
jgi:hypothetical protein